MMHKWLENILEKTKKNSILQSPVKYSLRLDYDPIWDNHKNTALRSYPFSMK